MSMSYQIQLAVYNKLAASTALAALVGTRIYDEVPQNPDAFPFVTISDVSIVESCTDDAEIQAIAQITVHSWSRYRGSKESLQIMDVIRKELHRTPLTFDDWRYISIDYESSEMLKDPDGLTSHGVSIFSLHIEEL